MDLNGDYLDTANQLATKLQNPSLTSTEICQIIAMNTFENALPAYVAFYTLDHEGFFSMTASFGLKRELVESRQNVPLTADLPGTRALRSNKLVWLDGSQTIESVFPLWANTDIPKNLRAIIAIPLRSMGNPVGVILIGGESFPLSEKGIQFLELMGSMISIWHSRQIRQVGKLAIAKADAPKDVALTTREKLIQGLMAKGWTNSQIAEDLGFSTSTIRQDSMSLFEKLGVNNRIDAGKLWESAQTESEDKGRPFIQSAS